MFGSIFYTSGRVDTSYGLFHDWKMSGSYYNNYADYRVGSQTTQYHWWNTAEASWHGPILRVGGTYSTILEYGLFAGMHSPLDMTYQFIGSGSLILRTIY